MYIATYLVFFVAAHALTLPQGQRLAVADPFSLFDLIPLSIRSRLNPVPGGKETPDSFILWDPTNSGSGPQPARAVTDMSLPRHTIYAPAQVNKSSKLPVILWGNGECFAVGTMFSEFLKEIASHGYLVIANGAFRELPSIPKLQGDYQRSPIEALLRSAPLSAYASLTAFLAGFTTADWQMEAVRWVEQGAANAAYGVPDLERMGAAGQSCGGTETYDLVSKYDKLKAIALFNSGDRGWSKSVVNTLKVPVGIFNGGPADFAFDRGKTDFAAFPPTIPAVLANIDAGHLGTFFAKDGGKDGKIAVAYWDATLKASQAAKDMFRPDGIFTREGWNVSTRNWFVS